MNTLSSCVLNFALQVGRTSLASVFTVIFACALCSTFVFSSSAFAANPVISPETSPEKSITESAPSLTNINEASPAVLAHGLEGIGPSKAEAIVHYREQHGAFRTVDDLVNVKGIGPKTLEKLRAHIVAGEFKKPEEGESLAEQEASARETVQAVVKRSLEIRKAAAAYE